MDDRSKKIFTEMAQEVMNREKVNIGDYEVDVDLLEDWNMYVSMDILDFISIYRPKNSDDLETKMVQMIADTLRGTYKDPF